MAITLVALGTVEAPAEQPFIPNQGSQGGSSGPEYIGNRRKPGQFGSEYGAQHLPSPGGPEPKPFVDTEAIEAVETVKRQTEALQADLARAKDQGTALARKEAIAAQRALQAAEAIKQVAIAEAARLE